MADCSFNWPLTSMCSSAKEKQFPCVKETVWRVILRAYNWIQWHIYPRNPRPVVRPVRLGTLKRRRRTDTHQCFLKAKGLNPSSSPVSGRLKSAHILSVMPSKMKQCQIMYWHKRNNVYDYNNRVSEGYDRRDYNQNAYWSLIYACILYTANLLFEPAGSTGPNSQQILEEVEEENEKGQYRKALANVSDFGTRGAGGGSGFFWGGQKPQNRP